VSISGSAMYTVKDQVYRMANASCITPAPAALVSPAEKGKIYFVIGLDSYTVNGMVYSMDAVTYLKNNRTYVPVRYLAYALGITPENVRWEGESRTATLRNETVEVVLTCGSTDIYVNGRKKTMDVAAELEKDRLMVPARWVAEAFGARVGWDGIRRTVILMVEPAGSPLL
jgi:hypothetical protein